MKKLFVFIPILLAFFNFACQKNKPNEIEIPLPTPIASPTALIPTSTPIVPLPNWQYTIQTVKGTTLIIPYGQSVPESADIDETAQEGDELLTGDDSEMTLALDPRTLIELAPNSCIKIIDLSPNITKGFTSEIQLLTGEILAKVQKLNENHSHFEIESSGVVCTVKGTVFEVQKKGDEISTDTFQGLVEMKAGLHVHPVNTNEHLVFSLKKSRFSTPERLTPFERKHFQAWMNSLKPKIQLHRHQVHGKKKIQRPRTKKRFRNPAKTTSPTKHPHAMRPKKHARHRVRSKQTPKSSRVKLKSKKDLRRPSA